MAQSLFESFQTGFEGGKQNAIDRRKMMATQMASQRMAAGDTSGAQQALLGEGMWQEAGAAGELGKQQRAEKYRVSMQQAAAGLSPTATRKERLTAQRDVANQYGEIEQANTLDDQLSQLDDDQRTRAGEAFQFFGQTAAALSTRNLDPAAAKAEAIRALQASPHSTPEIVQQIQNLPDAEFSADALRAKAQQYGMTADQILGEATRQKERSEDNTREQGNADRSFNEQRRQFNVSEANQNARSAADLKAQKEANQLDDDALEVEATAHAMGAPIPRNMSHYSKQIAERAAAIRKEKGWSPDTFALAQAANAGNKAALGKLQTQRAQVGVAEQTALSNLRVAQQLSREVPRSAIPLINRALLEGRAHISGDPKVVAFYNALQTSREEYAKVLSGNTSATGITDSSRNEAARLIRPDMTPEQIDAAVDTATREMANRMDAFDGAMLNLGQSMEEQSFVTGGHGGAAGTTTTTAPKPAAGPAVGTVMKGYRFKGGDPNNPQSWEQVSQQPGGYHGR